MKSTLSLFFFLLFMTGDITHAQLSAGLVAHYPFGGSADDVSGYDNHGIISGSVSLTADRFGAVDCAYEFDGDTASYIRVPYDTSLSYTGNPISISLWYKGGSADDGDLECLFGQWSGMGYSGLAYYLYLSLYDVNRATFCERIWEDLATTDTGGIDWHHLVAIYDDGDYAMYKDNILVGTASATPIASSTNYFVIGRAFEGKIDDIRVYDRAITTAEIDSIFNLPGSCEVLGLNEPVTTSYSVYPNPTTGIVRIESGNIDGKTEVSVSDITGRTILSKYIAEPAGSVDLSSQPAGIYILKLHNGSGEKAMLIQKKQ